MFMAVAKSAGKAGSKPPLKSAIPVRDWLSIASASVVLVSGAEDFLADRAISKLRADMREAAPDLEVSDIDASSYQPGQLFDLASPSLFGEPRFIRVASVEKCTDEFLEDALKFVEQPTDDVTVVLRHGGGVRGKKLLDTVRSGKIDALEVVCAELKSDNDKAEFAAAEFRIGQRKATPGAIRALVSAFASSGSELANACQQLMSDASGDITEQTVDTYYAGRVEATAFKVADSAIEGRLGDALLTLRQALDTGADPVPIVAAFASKLRLMAKVAGQRKSSNELASIVGAAPWQIDRAKRDIINWNDRGLGNAIIAVADADAGVKGASRDPVYALERMVRIVANFGADEA
jgi:DNA polymerase-3 subunit delta